MSKPLLIAALLLAELASFSAVAQAAQTELDTLRYISLVAEIDGPQAPAVRGRQIVFTAAGNARHVGIAFEHEGYATVHSFIRLVPRGDDDSPASVGAQSTLFYIMEIPEATSEIRYRIVRDGLWMPDPLNPQSAYDFAMGARVSVIQVEPWQTFQTSVNEANAVRFVYEGESGEVIRLAGTFNNWDPFMYEMKEIERGKYELILPLPRGTWYYAFFKGTTQIRDESTSMKVYTKDGRIASVIVVE